jgi:hypothetical protein
MNPVSAMTWVCVMGLAAVAHPALAAVPVELSRTGDDGMTLRAFAALEKAFDDTPDFTRALVGETTVKVAITSNLAWRTSGGVVHVTAPYQISRTLTAPRVGEATCTEATLPVCADKIVSATRKYLKKR